MCTLNEVWVISTIFTDKTRRWRAQPNGDRLTSEDVSRMQPYIFSICIGQSPHVTHSRVLPLCLHDYMQWYFTNPDVFIGWDSRLHSIIMLLQQIGVYSWCRMVHWSTLPTLWIGRCRVTGSRGHGVIGVYSWCRMVHCSTLLTLWIGQCRVTGSRGHGVIGVFSWCRMVHWSTLPTLWIGQCRVTGSRGKGVTGS
jgi:hypothetical protein